MPWTITPTGIASGEYRFSTTGANGSAPFALDTTKQVQDQLGQLASYVRELRALIAPIDQQIVRLERAAGLAHRHRGSGDHGRGPCPGALGLTGPLRRAGTPS